MLFAVLLISCHINEPDESEISTGKDSAGYYFVVSQDMTIEVSDRLKAINKAIKLSGGLGSFGFSGQLAYHKNWLHFSSGQYDSLIFYHQKLFEDLSENINAYYLGQEHYLMGYYFSEVVHNSEKAFQSYTLSKGYYEKNRDSSWIGRNLLNMGTIQKDQSDFFGSKETLTEALKYLTTKKDITYIVQCYNLLATNHRKLLNFQDAINYYAKAIELTDSPIDKLIYQNNLAVTYIDNRQLKLAIKLLDSISHLEIPITNPKEEARFLDNLAYAKWLAGDKITQTDFQNPLNIRISFNDERGKIASYAHLGEYNIRANPKRAEAYFDSVIQLSKKLKRPRAETDVLKFLMVLHPNSLGFRDRYILLKDSLYQQELNVKTQFAKYKYDDEVKQNDILQLEKENTQQELKVAKQRSQKILAYAIGIPVLLLLGFLTYFFVQRSKRLKRENKTARLEATFETEADLSRKLHDDFGGKLNHVMLLLQNGADNLEVLDVVDGLYNQSRDFSREINDVDTGLNFKDSLFGMVGNYSKNVKLIVTGSNDVDWLKISPLSKKTLFKVLQELMINMQKHSDAKLVSLAFSQSKQLLIVSYADDGVGASKEKLNFKNGLWNTEKRIVAIDGTIIFDSEKGEGFQVQIEIPN